MTTTEVLQLCLIVVFLSVSYWWFWTWADREQRSALINTRSTEYRVARTGSMLVPSFDPYVEKGAWIFIPSSDGLYATLTSLGGEYRKGLMGWLERGANISVVVCRPNADCCQEWQPFVDAFPQTFHLYQLNREALTGPNADLMRLQIERLDTFHPVILVNPKGSKFPGAMWIEGYHGIGSKYAYNVEFVHPSDVTKDGRFEKYQEMYKELLKGPHVTTLAPSKAVTLKAA
jgi:hypothetical protein